MKPVIYQIFTRLYGADAAAPIEWGSRLCNGCGTFADIDTEALERMRQMGISHVWYTGVIRHACCTHYDDVPDSSAVVVKGRAGSPYAITDYYDVDPDLATNPAERMEEFHDLVRRTHEAGLKVITDFVPNHVARQYNSTHLPEGVRNLGEDDNKAHAFNPQNNFYYIPNEPLRWNSFEEWPAKATGNDVFSACPGQNDWYETVKLNYGVDYAGGGACHFDPIPDTWHKMLDIMLFWASKGIDGLRCDMAEMVPVEFWHWAIARVKEQYPGIIFIAEVYNPSQYRSYIQHGGFDYLYDKVGLYDTLRDVMCGRRWASEITHAWQAVDDIREHMLSFLENHDEQRIASPQFAGSALPGRPGMIVAACLGTAPTMIYCGQELGEQATDAEGFSGLDGRTTIFDYWTVQSLRRMRHAESTKEEKNMQDFYSRLLNIVSKERVMQEGALFDLTYANPPSDKYDPEHVFSFMRYTDKEVAIVTANFSDKARTINLIIPQHAFGVIGMREKNATAVELLSGKPRRAQISPNITVRIPLEAYGGSIIRFRI